MVKLTVAVALPLVLLAACAHRAEKRPIKLPGAAEIGGYVAARWGPDFNQRFSGFAARAGRSAVFVSVQNARCEHNWGGTIADCSYDVTATFSGGEEVTRPLWSEFERGDDGALNEVIIMWHERRH